MALAGGLRCALRPTTAAGPSRLARALARPPRLCAGVSGVSGVAYSVLAHPRRFPSPSLSPVHILPAQLLPAHLPPAYTQRRSLFSSAPVITSYLDLPADYDDAEGLPFRSERGSGSGDGDLLPEEVARVFGRGMSMVAANRLLRILHGRRVAGTLDDPDPALRVNTLRYPAAEIETALAYLRATTPVDEVVNAGLRAEDELAALGETELEPKIEAETEPKPETEPETRADKWKARLFRKEAPPDDVYGTGAFDRIRARNRVKNEIREQQRAADEAARRAAQEKAWAENGVKVREVVLADGQTRLEPVREPRPMSARLVKYAEAATSHLDAPPELTRWQRLWPSYALVLALVGGGGVAMEYFEGAAAAAAAVGDSPGGDSGRPGGDSDSPSASLFSTLSPSAVTVGALIAANAAVFVLWRVPPLWRLLNRYMIVVPATPRPLSLLGAMFSHQKAGHLLANTAFLWLIGQRLHDEIGRPAFLQVYFASGLLAFLASMTNIVLRGQLHLTTLGASGAIYGIATAYFMMHKFEGFKILGLPPDPYTGIQGLGFVGLMLGLNVLALRAEKQSIDVVTHFVGMGVGAVLGDWLQARGAEAAAAAADGRPPRSAWRLLVDRVAHNTSQ